MLSMIIYRWSGAKPGHEVEAMQLADEATARNAQRVESGELSSHEWISNITGTDGGMYVIRGDQQQIAAVMGTGDFASTHLRGVLHLADWRWDMALCGSSVDEVYPGWRELVGA